MLSDLKDLPGDKILELMGQYRADPRPEKIDLGVGVYKDAQGETPVLSAVKQAEERLLATESSKSYVGPAGAHRLLHGLRARLPPETPLRLRDASALRAGPWPRARRQPRSSSVRGAPCARSRASAQGRRGGRSR